ncbi:hypothetical protein RCL1_009170 [Eukaryota sp. TZLM3-RCL]
MNEQTPSKFFILPAKKDGLLIGCVILTGLGLLTKNSLIVRLSESDVPNPDDDYDLDSRYDCPVIANAESEPDIINRGNDALNDVRFQVDDNTEITQIQHLIKEFADVWDPVFPKEGIDCEPMPITFHDEEKVVQKHPRSLNPIKLKLANELFDSFIEVGVAHPKKMIDLSLLAFHQKKMIELVFHPKKMIDLSLLAFHQKIMMELVFHPKKMIDLSLLAFHQKKMMELVFHPKKMIELVSQPKKMIDLSLLFSSPRAVHRNPMFLPI